MEEFASESGNPAAFGQMQMLPEMLFMRMRAELSKVSALIEMTEDALDMNYSIVIFVNFLTTLKALESLAFDNVQTIHGEQKIHDRELAIAAFQKDKARVIVSTIDSGGAGISLHDVTGVHPRLALICPTWRAVTLRQSLGRVHRAGGRSKALQKLVYAAGTIEETVADRVRGKLNQIDLINDADLAEAEFAPA
jgi:superfamily II DNA or RNA helicase